MGLAGRRGRLGHLQTCGAALTLILPRLTSTPSPNFSSRYGNRVRLIVVHDCEGSFAGSVSWFSQARSQVSAHIVLSEDGARAVQMVAFANKAWHACAFNPFSEGIEAAGYAAKGLGAAEWQALAAIVAFRMHENGIPCQVASASNGWTGFCQHVDLGAAGGGHHDITSDPAIWGAFVAKVEMLHAEPMPDVWRPTFAEAAPTMPDQSAPRFNPRYDFEPPSLEWVQAVLNRLGIPHTPLTVDGIEGVKTRAAIVDFQERAHLFIDGEAGPKTCAALEKAGAA